MLPTQLTAPSMAPSSAASCAGGESISAASQFTCALHGSSVAHAGHLPVREIEATEQPASTSALHTRLPMKPLPPKTA